MGHRWTSDRRAAAVFAALAVLAPVVGVIIGSSVASAASPHPATVIFQQDGHFTVPAGVDSITVTVVGGGGGAGHELLESPSAGGQQQAHPGRSGRTVHATIDVSGLSGRTLDVIVGTAGRPGLIETGAGGTGFGDGGNGGTNGSGLHGNDVLGFGGGGGGGASAVLDGSRPLVVAGGGGGGGSVGPLVLGAPLNYFGGNGCTWPVATAPGDSVTGPTPPCPVVNTPPTPTQPSLPDACTETPDPIGRDGGDGANEGIDGDLMISTGGGGGGGWVGGPGGRPAAKVQSGEPRGAIDTCTGDGVAGTDHVAADGVSVVTQSSDGLGGVDGSVTITYAEPGTKVQGTEVDASTSSTTAVPATSTLPQTTMMPPTTDPSAPAPAATAVEARPRYTG